MKRIVKIAAAFVAVIVGAGFASGQEILLFFTGFGLWGILAACIATCLFTYFGMILLKIGSRLQTTSHKETFHLLSGQVLGTIMDIVITCAMFGVGVVMISGAGAIVRQQFDISPVIGSLALSILIILTMLLDVEKIITLLGMTVPFLIVAIVCVSVYSMRTMEFEMETLSLIARNIPSPVQHWFVSGLNYVSFNITLGAGMALLIGGAEKDERKAAIGGLLGGLIIGMLMILTNVAMFMRVETIINVEMPLLLLMNEISIGIGICMTLVLLAMIFSTAVGAFYTFIARFFDMTSQAKIIPIIVTVFLSFIASFIGFTKLIALFYPFIGYFGFGFMIILLFAPPRLKNN